MVIKIISNLCLINIIAERNYNTFKIELSLYPGYLSILFKNNIIELEKME